MTTNIYNMADTWNNIATTFDAIKMNVTDGAAGFPVGAAASQLINIQTNATQRFGVRSPHFALGADITPFLNLVDIWNTSGAAVGIRYNTTDTASAVASLMMDLQVGGTTVFNIRKNGVITCNVTGVGGNGGGILSGGSGQFGGFQFGGSSWGSNGIVAFDANATYFALRGSMFYGWENGSNNPATGTIDVRLYRDAANTLAQRNSTTAQTFNIYNTFTDASNYERGIMSWSKNSNRFSIGIEALGTGTNRPVDYFGASHSFKLTGVGGVWQIDSQGHLSNATDNTYDIGASGTTRPRNYYGASWVKYSVVTLASLSASFNSATSAGVGAQAFVTDLTTASFVLNTTAAGGGTLPGPVYSDGTQWKVG